ADAPRGAPGPPSPVDDELCSLIGAARARDDSQPRYRADGRQRLTAEAERGDGFEVTDAGDLAGCVPRERHRQLLGRDAAAVVAHPHEADAAALDVDVDARGPSIERVLGKLLDDRGGSLNHLAGCDLVDELIGKDADRHWDRSVHADRAATRRGRTARTARTARQGVAASAAPPALTRLPRCSCLKRVPSGGF